MLRRKKQLSDLGAADLGVVVFDLILVVLWILAGTQAVLGAILVVLLVLSAIFLGWIPLPGDRTGARN